jgi:YHS domain-containing protein
MVRLFLFFLLLAAGYAFLRIFLKQLQQGPRRSAPPPTRSGEQMVRDPVCGTYLPASTAIAAEIDGQSHHFCSAACRDAYRAKP